MIKNETITEFINTKFKSYAVYTLENRGIPNFYDSLTNVQRIILLNTPLSTTKTLSVVGDCIKNGNYHHGNSSLESAINRLARPFACSENLLNGDGFFGNQVNIESASARYTSVQINKFTHDIIREFKYLNKRDDESNYLPLHITIPLGILLPIMGISVGYRTMILPRNLKHIKEYLVGKRKKIIPYFKDFEGKVSNYKDLDSSWIIEGNVSINEKRRSIHVTSLPPLMKYDSFIKKINRLVGDTPVKFINDSKDKIDVTFKFNKKLTDDIWQFLKIKITKATKLIVRENIIFIKDGIVLEYNTIEDYLLDFQTKNEFLQKENLNYHIKSYTNEIQYLKAKLKYLNWMEKVQKTTGRLNESKILAFLNKYPDHIKCRLDAIKLRRLNDDEIDNVTTSIKEYIKKTKKTKDELSIHIIRLNKLPKRLNTINKDIFSLFNDELENINDIEIFKNTDEII